MHGSVTSLLAAAVTIVISLASPRAAERTPADLASALQGRYSAIADFSADFVHTYVGGVLRRRAAPERGTVVVKKPGRMRWEYKSPEEKLFVSDGRTIYSYYPADRQVAVTEVPNDGPSTTPTLFLAGEGHLGRDFAPSFVEVPDGMPRGAQALKLVPHVPQSEYDWLVLVVDADTLVLRGLMSVDAQGGTSTFVFTNLKENVRPADALFTFTVPRGVEVYTNGAGGR